MRLFFRVNKTSQQKCCISCGGSITGCPSVSQGKQDTSIPQWKCCISYMGGMLDRSCVHAQHIGERCGHEDCVCVWEII